MLRYILLFAFIACIGAGCDKEEEDNVISGEVIINGQRVRFSTGYLQVDNNSNRLVINGNDGSVIEFLFDGDKEKVHSPLGDSSPSATYTSPNGEEFISYNGTLQIDEYEKGGERRKVSGLFEFSARSQQGGSDVLVTNGMFNNVQEEQ